MRRPDGLSSRRAGRRFRSGALATTVSVDGNREGARFQGIGAISGGGGNSRYLIDYPLPQRRAILDELFSPHDGAALQLLKIEIGGDADSSDGSEPSVEVSPGRLACGVGYELWLAREAVRRDPAIRLYGLQWSAPGWVRGPRGTLWTSRDIRYLLDWLGCARRYGLRISYLGGWNEHYTPDSSTIERWYVELRRALDRHGYRFVTIVAADDYGTRGTPEWAVVEDMDANRAFDRAVGVIGIHDACGARSGGFACRGSPLARRLARTQHKLLWQSELGRTPTRVSCFAGRDQRPSPGRSTMPIEVPASRPPCSGRWSTPCRPAFPSLAVASSRPISPGAVATR